VPRGESKRVVVLLSLEARGAPLLARHLVVVATIGMVEDFPARFLLCALDVVARPIPNKDLVRWRSHDRLSAFARAFPAGQLRTPLFASRGSPPQRQQAELVDGHVVNQRTSASAQSKVTHAIPSTIAIRTSRDTSRRAAAR